MFKSTVHRIQLRQARQAKSKLSLYVCCESAQYKFEFGKLISEISIVKVGSF